MSLTEAPAFVVPAAKKCSRNWVSAALLIEKLGLQYPQPALGLVSLPSPLESPL